MVIDGVNANQSTQSNKAAASASVGYNDFLQLLIAQMKNQDPTSPTDMAQYMSQFAQLSQVEQSIQTNAKLDTLLSTSALSQAEGMIGRTVTFTGEDGQSNTGKIASVSIIQGGAVAKLESGVQVLLGPGITIS